MAEEDRQLFNFTMMISVMIRQTLDHHDDYTLCFSSTIQARSLSNDQYIQLIKLATFLLVP